MNTKKNSITIGIPTYYGGPALVKAVRSIMASASDEDVRVIVNIDGNPLEPKIEAQLKKLGADVVFSKERGGQVARIKQMIRMTKSEYLILTQDDIVFLPDTVEKIKKAFEDDPELTMLSARLLPHPAETFLEKIVEVGVRLTHRIGDLWRHGDNYLLSSGRCIAYRTEFVKKLDIPVEVINSDAYLYLENKVKGGKFKGLKNTFVYNRSPQKLKEQLKQSKKFQYSLEELTKYLDINLSKEYSIPFRVGVLALIEEIITNPLFTILYLGMYAYTRVFGQGMYSGAKRFWATDVSTKKS